MCHRRRGSDRAERLRCYYQAVVYAVDDHWRVGVERPSYDRRSRLSIGFEETATCPERTDRSFGGVVW